MLASYRSGILVGCNGEACIVGWSPAGLLLGRGCHQHNAPALG